MVDLLVDTNIVIYALEEQQKYVCFFDARSGVNFGVSVITYMETLMGSHSKENTAKMQIFFDRIEIIPLDITIAQKSVASLRQAKHRSLRSAYLADTIIGQTALELGVPLVTNNPKDFVSLKGLKIITP